MKKFALFLILLCVCISLPLSAKAAPKTIYAVNSGFHTYHTVPAADFAKIEKALNLPAGKAKLDEKAKDTGGFCIFYADGSKTLYTFTETQILKDGKPLTATAAQRKELQTLCKRYWSRPAIPELLGYMSTEKITEVSFGCMAIGPMSQEGLPWILLIARAEDEPGLVERFAAIMRTLEVTPDKTTVGTWGPSNLGTDEMSAEITFSTGVKYQMRLWDNSFFIHTSDDPVNRRIYHYAFAPSGMANPRGWYLRAEMEELSIENSWLAEAVIVKSPERSPEYVRLTKETEFSTAALRQLSAFKERFLNPGPNDTPPPWGSDKAGFETTVAFYLPEYDGTYTEYRLWSDEKGGMTVSNQKRTLYPLRPGDCAYILSLMEAGAPMTPGDADALLNNPR